MRNTSRNWLAAIGIALASLLMLAACGGDDDIVISRQEKFTATLDGAQEVPPVSTTASGTGTVVVNTSTREMTATINTTNIAGNAAHIHEGPRGVDGPVVFGLTETAPGNGIWTTSVILTEAQLATLRAGNFYFNVHTTAFPGGEIRGQIEDESTQRTTTTTTTSSTAPGATTTAPTTSSTAPGATTTTSAMMTTTTTEATTTTAPGATITSSTTTTTAYSATLR